MHLRRFKQDVARWIVPEEVRPLEEVTLLTTLRLLYRHIPLRAMLLFRFGSWCADHHIRLLPGITQRLMLQLYGLEMVVGGNVGGGFYVPHPVGTVITGVVGQNCTVIGAATLGMRNEGEFPTLGDGVFVGIGARILGGVHVAAGARIGANAVVLDDVPPGTTVVGVPARPVRSSNDGAGSENGASALEAGEASFF